MLGLILSADVDFIVFSTSSFTSRFRIVVVDLFLLFCPDSFAVPPVCGLTFLRWKFKYFICTLFLSADEDYFLPSFVRIFRVLSKSSFEKFYCMSMLESRKSSNPFCCFLYLL